MRLTSTFVLALFIFLVATLLSACRPGQPFDPLAATTPFAFEIDNAEGIEGQVFGLLLYPFEPVARSSEVERYGAALNGFIGAALNADGIITGTLIAPRDVPRVNDNLGWIGGTQRAVNALRRVPSDYSEWFLLPPPECPMSATNHSEASFAAIQGIIIWDGETLDDNGIPVPTQAISLYRHESDDNGGVLSDTVEALIPIVSRVAWSVSSDGPCAVESLEGFTLDVDLAVDIGWQLLYVSSVFTYEDMSVSEHLTLRIVSLEDMNDVADVWHVVSLMPY